MSERSEVEQRPVLRPIPQWVVVLGIPVMVLTAMAAVWLLLGFGVVGVQLDAIRTGGTVGVGLGGAVVLWLAVRRQRSTELDLLQKYEAHRLAERVATHNEVVATDNRTHQLQVAEASERDATARRITDLYSKAVDQLGSEKAPVRLGGLYALERLAQDTPQLRQTIVNVLCAYLRMPYTLPDESRDEQLLQEREVRLTAQRILRAHLNPGLATGPSIETFWPDIDLDLTGATLMDFDLADCSVHTATFRKSTFSGRANFSKTRFGEDAGFDEAVFVGSAEFSGAEFTEGAAFGGAKFTRYAWFDQARFRAEAKFGEAEFLLPAYFSDAELLAADFDRATFTDVDFRSTKLDFASFRETKFVGPAYFGAATFAGAATFDQAEFSDIPGLDHVIFIRGWPPELERFRPAQD